MNKQLSILLTLLIGLSTYSFAQDAKSILDNLSKKTATYKSIKATFEYKMTNVTDKIDETQNGSLITQGDKYHLNISTHEVISNGKDVWTVLNDVEEVQISSIDDEEEDDYISPSNILRLWEKGFKYKYDKEIVLNGNATHVINLYPENPAEKSFHTIQLYVKKAAMEPAQIVIKGKDGTNFTYKIKTFETNLSLPANTFTFNKTGYEVIDLR